MQRYLPWIIAILAVSLAGLMYFENRRVLQQLRVVAPTEATQPHRLALPATPAKATATPTPFAETGAPARSSIPTTGGTSPHLTLAGSCVDPRGHPIAGAKIISVWLLSPPAQHRETRNTFTDERGAFAITYTPGEVLEYLRAEHNNFCSVDITKIESYSKSLRLVLEPRGHCEIQLFRQSGERTLDRYSGPATFYFMRRTPVEAENPTALDLAEATAQPGRFVVIGAEQASVQQGRHGVDGYPPGVYKVAVVAGNDYAESDPFKLVAGEPVVVTIVLGQRQRFSGYVLAEGTSQPVPRATVRLALQKSPAAHLPNGVEAETHTNSEGHFVFEKVIPSVYTLTISADNFTTRVVDELAIPSDDQNESEPIYFLKSEDTSFVISVIDYKSEPIRAARIALLGVAGAAASRTYFGETDQRGVCSFRGLPPGRYSLTVSLGEGSVRQKQLEVFVSEDQSPSLRVQFQRPVHVRGTVRDASGQPYAGLLYFVPRGAIGPKIFVKCDLSGQFQAQLEPGDYAVGRGGEPASLPAKIPELDPFELELNLR